VLIYASFCFLRQEIPLHIVLLNPLYLINGYEQKLPGMSLFRIPLPIPSREDIILLVGKVNLFTPRVSYGDIKVVLTFDSVDKILWCNYSNETLSAVFLHGTSYI